MTADVIPFNPLDKKNLGASVAEAMLARKASPLGQIEEFTGAGIYAIYYSGGFKPYAEVSKRNAQGKYVAPIYVGKAVFAGARTGTGRKAKASDTPLYDRLAEHAESIRGVINLEIDDFHCRYLVVDDIWIALGESVLIAHFSPVWNAIVTGFGNHDPGAGRYNGMRPRWDVVHPGRTWAARCKDRKETDKDIMRDATTFLANMIFPTSNRFIEADG